MTSHPCYSQWPCGQRSPEHSSAPLGPHPEVFLPRPQSTAHLLGLRSDQMPMETGTHGASGGEALDSPTGPPPGWKGPHLAHWGVRAAGGGWGAHCRGAPGATWGQARPSLCAGPAPEPIPFRKVRVSVHDSPCPRGGREVLCARAPPRELELSGHNQASHLGAEGKSATP